jgi:uncharacterized membrane protein YdjX (TVP38/TMEM64 family)
MNRPHLPVWLRGIFLILSLIGLGLLLKSLGLEHLFQRAWIDANVRGQGLHGYGLYLAAGALITAIGLPRQVVAFFAGYAFGVLQGTLLGALASLMGCMLTFSYSRLFGRSLVRRLFPERLQRFDNFIQGHPFSMTLLVRLLPVGNNLVTNLIAGVSHIPKLAFVLFIVSGLMGVRLYRRMRHGHSYAQELETASDPE